MVLGLNHLKAHLVVVSVVRAIVLSNVYRYFMLEGLAQFLIEYHLRIISYVESFKLPMYSSILSPVCTPSKFHEDHKSHILCLIFLYNLQLVPW